MNPVFNNGQEVIVRPVDLRSASTRDSTLEPFSGKVGKVVDSFWISPEAGRTFYLYRVRFPENNKELVLHEDEIKSFRK
jgi:hypothetical protein